MTAGATGILENTPVSISDTFAASDSVLGTLGSVLDTLGSVFNKL